MRKVSLIATVLNEREALRQWLEELKRQTRQPDEIVICDGGSTDGTLEALQSFAHENPQPPLRVVSRPDANIATGRNAAIAEAGGEIIAVTDAGCRPDPEWLAEIVKPFEVEPATQVVAGHYRFLQDTRFRKAAAAYLGRPWEKPSFLPSSRSIAFTKEVWRKVEGYPEWLTQAAEDTLFDLSLIARGIPLCPAPKALVVWNMRPNLWSFLRMIHRNARGDAEAGIGRKAFLATLAKFMEQFIFLLLALILGAQMFTVWVGIFGALALIPLALIVRALVCGAPLESWPEFFLLCLLGGPAYCCGYLSFRGAAKHAT